MDFMRIALKDVPDEEPEIPAGIVTVRIDPATGAKATAATAGAIFEMFREENAPGVTAAANTDDEGRLTSPVVTPPAARDLF
jgi:penicillin-binding protein 1A